MSGGSMDEEMKDFWKYFVALVLGAVIALAGALIGKTIIGDVLFGLGLVLVVAAFVFVFRKKNYFKNGRLKVLILGLVMSALLASSAVLIINEGGGRLSSTGTRSSIFSQLSRVTGGSSTSSQFRNFGSTGTYSARSGNAYSGQGGFGTNGTYSGRFSSGTSGTGTSGTTGTGTSTAQTTAMRNNMMRRMILTLIGWVLLAAGAILLIVAVIRFLTKKTNYKGDRWKVLLLGLLVGALVASSTAFFFTKTASANYSRQGSYSQGFTGTPRVGQNGTPMPVVPGAQPSETAAATATATPTPDPTNTPRPTATVTLEVFQSQVVCLDYNIQIGINIRDFPGTTGANVGTIPAGGCFTLDGKNSSYAGWYHMAPGQNGLGGIVIRGGQNSTSLWVNDKNFDKSNSMINDLPEVTVTPSK
jgi:hypothetical protein